MSNSGMSLQKRGFVFLGVALCISIAIYALVGALVTAGKNASDRPGTDGIRLFFLLAGFFCLAGALFLAPRARESAGDAPPMNPGLIRARGFRALIASEMATIFGIVGTFMTFRLSLVLVLGAGSLAANLLWILPQALRLFDEAESRAAVGGA